MRLRNSIIPLLVAGLLCAGGGCAWFWLRTRALTAKVASLHVELQARHLRGEALHEDRLRRIQKALREEDLGAQRALAREILAQATEPQAPTPVLLEELTALGDGGLPEVTRQALEAEQPAMQRLALQALGRCGDGRQLPLVAQLLDGSWADDPARERVLSGVGAALIGLLERGHQGATPLLQQLATDRTFAGRFRLAVGMARSGEPALVATLVAALAADPDLSMRCYAAQALGAVSQASPAVEEGLQEALRSDPYRHVRINAATALWQRQERRQASGEPGAALAGRELAAVLQERYGVEAEGQVRAVLVRLVQGLVPGGDPGWRERVARDPDPRVRQQIGPVR